MIEVAIIISMVSSAFLLAYVGFQLGEEHASMKILMISVALFFGIGSVFTGYMFALNGASTQDIYSETNEIEQNLQASTGLFDGIDVNNRQTLFHVEPTVPLNERRNDWVGNVTWTGSTYRLTGTAQIRSEQRGEYQPGSTAQVGQMIRVTDPPTEAGEEMKWLYFNDINGFYFGVNTTCTYVELQKNNETLKSFCQSDWNVNTVDSTEPTESNPSGFKLDLNDANMYQAEYAWYGAGLIEMDIIFDTADGQETVTVHRFDVDNQTSLGKISLPVKARILNDPDSSTSMDLGGRQYAIQDNYEPTERNTKVFVESMTASSTEYTPAISVRSREKYNNVALDIVDFESTPTCDVNAMVRYDTELTGASWQEPSLVRYNETIIEVDKSATSWQNGTGTFTGNFLDFAQLPGGDNKNKPVSDIQSAEISSVIGDDEVVTLAFKADDTSCDVTDITLQVKEDY